MIPQYNDTVADMEAIAEFLLTLPYRPSYELMTFHGICAGKYTSLGLPYAAEGLSSPSKEQMQTLADVFRRRHIHVSIR